MTLNAIVVIKLECRRCLWNWECKRCLWNWECKSAYGTGSEEQTATEQNGQIKVIGFYSKKKLFQCWFSRFIFFDTISPALENTLSHGTEDAGVHKYVSASWYKWGYWCFCLLQYKSGSSCLSRLTLSSSSLLRLLHPLLHLSSVCSVPPWYPADAKGHL